MSQQAPGKKRGLSRPVEVVRAELLKDPETKRIADAVGMKLEDYVELVLEYAQDKDKEPMLNVVSDEELKANGFPVHTVEEVGEFLVAGAKGELPGQGNPFAKSEFEASKGGTAGKPSLNPAAEGAPQTPQDEAKRQELLEQMKKGGGGTRG
ncbi:hypothetical protein HRD49_35015 [Corallococcus exiguus]|uniref:Uncharacterized protein n=1 Tax=Corallococcus exiguus TaxID=83462 RepID=A0A7X5BV12_9BACT|nr:MULTISPECIES: hypothetical protein [Corallococcus]RKI44797.1 hypothetical protein D7Y27_12345 [Corallococcus sp. AB004]MBN8470871.1 hypothetical protein [Corallococcus exiguus]NBC44955.1 hypothetical protein [Corallococcus exiguus]NNB91396.1 hypothetical protein [Corallococcus exiguus]NNC00543.1 hypothetical protein [Corallococcus exiguus]